MNRTRDKGTFNLSSENRKSVAWETILTAQPKNFKHVWGKHKPLTVCYPSAGWSVPKDTNGSIRDTTLIDISLHFTPTDTHNSTCLHWPFVFPNSCLTTLNMDPIAFSIVNYVWLSRINFKDIPNFSMKAQKYTEWEKK